MAFSLTDLQNTLSKSLITDAWLSDNEARGDMVSIYRDYADGKHDAKLTPEMKSMLRLDRAGVEFAGNYCDMVVQTMNSRLNVEEITGNTDAATKWTGELLKANRFDALQLDVHTSILEDGDTYVILEWDETLKRVVLHLEPAWDGIEGMLAIYDRQGRNMLAAVKVWNESDENGEDVARVNIYYPDRVVKYSQGGEGGTLTTIEEINWMPGKIPVVHFRNRAKRRSTHGISELQSVVPLQDALNRTLVSMVMTSELGAFPIRVAKFFQTDGLLTPGMIIEIPIPEGGDPEITKAVISHTSMDTVPQAQIVPFIEMINFLVDEIGTISRTPMPSKRGGSNESGEALKQREIDLLGKITQFQTKIGNAWEDVMHLAVLITRTFGTLPAGIAESTWDTKWRDAEMRNETEQISNILAVKDVIGAPATLRKLAPIINLTPKDIDDIEKGQKQAQIQQFNQLIASNQNGIPSFGANEFEPLDQVA